MNQKNEINHHSFKAIVVVDIVNYTKIMEEDSSFAIYINNILYSNKGIIAKALQFYNGKSVSYPGDAVLLIFDMPLDAVHFAVDVSCEIQKHNLKNSHKQFQVHLVIDYGEVFSTESGIFTGVAINRAFKVAKVSLPKFIFVTGFVYETLRSQKGVDFTNIKLTEDLFSNIKTNVYTVSNMYAINGEFDEILSKLEENLAKKV